MMFGTREKHVHVKTLGLGGRAATHGPYFRRFQRFGGEVDVLTDFW